MSRVVLEVKPAVGIANRIGEWTTARHDQQPVPTPGSGDGGQRDLKVPGMRQDTAS
jgi:hypothetical protein